MLFACMFVPDFAAEALVRAEPDLRDAAVVALEGMPPLLTVSAANERARQAGVESGMTSLQATARLHATQTNTHPIAMRHRSVAQELAAHAALADCARAFSPRVEECSAAPDTVLLDLDGLDRLFGNPHQIARELSRRASELGLEVNVAVAANLNAAICAARGFGGITVLPHGKESERLAPLSVEVLLHVAGAHDMRADAHGLAARPGTKSSRKRSQTTTSENDAPANARLTAERASELLDTLDRWGVRTFRALAALPEIALSERLGPEGVYLQKLCRGDAPRTLVPTDSPLVFEEVIELEYPIEDLESLAFVLGRLLGNLCARLSARALSTNELRLRLTLDPCPDYNIAQPETSQKSTIESNRGSKRINTDERQTKNEGQIVGTMQRGGKSSHHPIIRSSDVQSSDHPIIQSSNSSYERTLHLPVPMLDPKVFLRLWQLELRATPPAAPITHVWLRAEPVQPRNTQGGLFLPAAPEPERLELTLARIAAVVGDKKNESSKYFSPSVTERSQSSSSSVTPQKECHSEERSDEESAVSSTHEKKQVPRSARDDGSLTPKSGALSTSLTSKPGGPFGVGSRFVRSTHTVTKPPLNEMVSLPKHTKSEPREDADVATPDNQANSARSSDHIRSSDRHSSDQQSSNRLTIKSSTSSSDHPFIRSSDSFRVGTPEVLDTHRSDAFRINRFSPTNVPDERPAKRHPPLPEDKSAPLVQQKAAPSLLGRTALRLFRPPLAARVNVLDRRPVWIETSTIDQSRTATPLSGEIAWCAGPWRTSGEWWNDSWSRDEWDVAVETSDGRVVCRIYCDTQQGSWFVEGTYD
jgi:nucleotidyltransferase/DNA polymerase involved in DNA repair